MSTTPHNPLVERRNNAAEQLDRRRRTAAETSVKVAEGLNAYFDRLALLAAGALTFSVTLVGHPTRAHSHRLFIIYAAWACLLTALGSCLLRVFSNHGHRFYKVGANRAEAEVALIDADTEVLKVLGHSIAYSDAAEPFDKQRELKINDDNRAVWRKEFLRTEKMANLLWRIHQGAGWIAGVAMFLGFLLMMTFAIYNTYVP